MEDAFGQAVDAAEETDVNICDAEQAGGDTVGQGEHTFLPAACLPEAHQPLGTC